jgi:Phage tail protein (Tail_P2_I)
VGDKYFPWLAAWLALPLDAEMKPEKKRALLKTAFQRYLVRGTVGGLEQVIQDYADVPFARVLEHFRLRNWPLLSLEAGLDQGARLWSENLYRRLQVGTNSRIGSFQLTNTPEPAMEPFDFSANRFSVLFPADPYTVDTTKAKVQRVVDREKPAYAQAILCPIFPRLRIGIQATLGVDAVVGKVTPLVLGRMSTLSYDSVLSCSQAERDARVLGMSRHPRVGMDAKIL